MRNPLKRHYGKGDLHFVTFSCYRRLPLLGTVRARNHFVRVLDQVRFKHKFLLLGFVVMPEHVHLILNEPRDGNPSKVLQVLKQQVSRSLRKKRKRRPTGQLALQFANTPDLDKHFWQRRFYDFNGWSEKKLREELNYMHANPVKRGLVKHPRDWPWSSWSHYVISQAGIIRIDALEENQ